MNAFTSSKGKRNLPFDLSDTTNEVDRKRGRGGSGNQVLLKMMQDRQQEHK